MMLALGATSCIGDLDVDPIDPNIDTNVDLNGLFNKCYANMALAGNGGANGDCDIDGWMVVRQALSANCSIPTN